MLKTLDILIGATTVVLIFSMAVTVLTQVVTTVLSRRGDHLRDGLADLLQQLGISQRDVTEKISDAVLRHPMFSQGNGWWGKAKLGTVIHREEFTKILLDAASGDNAAVWASLDDTAKSNLTKMLQDNGISNPGATLKNVRALALQLEASNPELATDVRQSLALLHEATSDYVARMNSWFDQTIDRVSQRFTKHAHYVTVGLATVVVLVVQLDIIAIVDRLSVDDSLRNQIVQSAVNDPSLKPSAKTSSEGTTVSPTTPTVPEAQPNLTALPGQKYYDALGAAGLITMPFDSDWGKKFSARKLPGMVIAILLISLGAPFWYGILKDLLGLRSDLAKKDDQERQIRQTTQDSQTTVAPVAVSGGSAPAWLKGERGSLEPWG